MEISLKDKVALITGASRGIGAATALEMARCGADIVLASRKLDTLEVVANKIRELGRKAVSIPTHMGKMDDVENLSKKAVEEFGKIDILVNDAASSPTGDTAMDYTERAWDSVMNANLKGFFFLTQKIARVMKENGGGAIVNVASTEGLRPSYLVAYGISKAAIVHATKHMAKEWGIFNIRVNSVCPGITKTQIADIVFSNPDILKYAVDSTALKRYAEPEEQAHSIVFLASDLAAYITGANLVVDGGQSI